MNPYISQYQNNQITSASPEQILLMLYDGAIRFLKLAKNGINDNDMAVKGKYLGKALAIIAEFQNSLDHEIGGQIASDLDALYAYMLKELSTANVNNDKAPIDVVLDMLSGLRDTWAQAIEINNGQKNGQREDSDSSTSPNPAYYAAM